MGLAYLYFASPRYTVRAKLLIKDNEKGSGAETALKELNLFKSSTLAENELEVLASTSLLDKVIARLNLSTAYFIKKPIKSQEIYEEKPFTLQQVSAEEYPKPAVVRVVIRDKHSFLLKNKHSEQIVRFGETLKNASGHFTLVPTDDIDKFIGEEVKAVQYTDDATLERMKIAYEAKLTNKKATTIDLSIKDNIPQRGKDILNTLINIYNDESINDKNRVRQSTLAFIDKRLGSLTGELTSAEKTVEDYKSSKGMVDIASESKLFLDNVKENDTKMNTVAVQLEVIKGIEQYINSPHSGMHTPATAGITDPGLIALVNQLIALELKRDQISETAPEGSPVFEGIDKQINSTRASIRSNVAGIKSTLVASQSRMSDFNNKFESNIRQLPGQEREFITLKRQQSIKEGLYLYLLQKREEAAVSYASTIADSRTIDKAYSGSPDSPDKMLILAFSALAGLLIPVGMIYSRSLFNNKIESAEEITDQTSIPVLGELSYERTSKYLVADSKSKTMIAEQFRSLRTNLEYIYSKQQDGRITMLTSGMPGEGKSFVSCNLASALSNTGRKTVLLELDMRKPKISEYLDVNNKKGIANYLNGEVSLTDIIVPSSVNDNLYVACAGDLHTDPTVLLSKPELKAMLNHLSAQFDEVVIDTPPIELVADALIIAQHCDVNLFVMRQGVSDRNQLSFVKQLFNDRKLNNLNIVFNGTSTRGNNKYSYGYYYNDASAKSNKVPAPFRDFFHRF